MHQALDEGSSGCGWGGRDGLREVSLVLLMTFLGGLLPPSTLRPPPPGLSGVSTPDHLCPPPPPRALTADPRSSQTGQVIRGLR